MENIKGIEAIEKAIENENVRHQQEITKLKQQAVEIAVNFYASKGILPGTRVRVGKNVGIYEGINFGWCVDPIVKKIKKDGTPHATARIYVWYDDELIKE